MRGTDRPKGMQVLAWLREQGKLTATQHDEVLRHAQRTGARIEEALIELGTFEESELLKLLASLYRTRFVSTERLAKAAIDRRTLERVPHRIAEQLQVFPVLWDHERQTLSIVAAAPGEDELEKQVQLATPVRGVRAYVARPAAIAAAIDRFYRGNSRAFVALLAQAAPTYGSFDTFDSSMLRDAAGEVGSGEDFGDPFEPLVGPGPTAPAARRPAPPKPPAGPPQPAPMLDGLIPADLPGDVRLEPRGVEPETYLETLNVFVSLLEHDRDELRGHSSQVAKLAGRVAERVGMSDGDRHALLVAAYLHDVGKTSGGYHLTPLNVARYEGHRGRAQRTRTTPAKLFESAALPPETVRILSHLYERFDGQGFPDRLAGKDIPYGARVLAIVETYVDLVGNPRNPYRRVLSVPEALGVLRELGEQLFDPTLADVLRHLAADPDGRENGMGGRPRALVIDPDAEETTILEMRLIEHGFRVGVARDLATAREKLRDPPDVVVTEVELGGSADGFELLARIGEIPEGDRPEVIILTSRADRESVARGFELGAVDYLVKPASPEVVATKAGQALEGAVRKRADGVSGSLKEMSLPDVVQILSNGRRAGRLRIVAGAKQGEIHFSDGQIFDALFGALRGEEAFYAMLKLADGTFAFDPAFSPAERVIQVSPEGLLLEGMRRLDEGLV